MPYFILKLKSASIFAFLLVLFASISANTQTSISFEARTDAEQVLLNNYFEVYFTLKNANGTDFNPPDFKGFQVLSGPNSSTSMQIINGNVSREMGYSYTLQPTAIGKFTIGSATIKANGRKYSTSPIAVEVIAGNSNKKGAASAEGSLFIKIEPSKTEIYVGEQITLDFKLYTTVSIDGYEIMEEPDYRGFYAQELRRFNSNTQREIIDGKQYTTKILRRISLFPQQTGKLTVTPAKFQLAVLEEGDRTGFFFNRSVRPVFYTTSPTEIEVKPLPPHAPENFSGAVGKYEFQSSVNRNMVTTDDAVSVIMLITGSGDVKRVQAPPLVLSDSFEIYAPKILEEQMSENQGMLTGKKVIEYLVLPKFPGEYSISPAFTYFDPSTGNYVSKTAGPYPLNVRLGTDKHRTAGDDSSPKDNSNEIQFIKLRTKLSDENRRHFVSSTGFWTLSVFPLAAFFGFLLFRNLTDDSHKNIDTLLKKKKLANKEAQKRLETAKQYMEALNSKAFYDEVSKACLGYISDKLNIPLSQLSKENINMQMQHLGIPTELIREFTNTLQTCELALFGGMDNATDISATYNNAVTVIAKIEELIEGKSR